MNLRWLWFNHVPPDLGLPRSERKKVKRLALQRSKFEPKFYGANRIFLRTFIPFAVISIVVFAGGFKHRMHFPPFWAFFAIYYTGFAWAKHRSLRPFVRKVLNEQGYPVCMKCGQILIGVANECCPECGERRLSVPLRRLNALELYTPGIVDAMKRLGYGVCMKCGAMWFDDPRDPLPCPECKRDDPSAPLGILPNRAERIAAADAMRPDR